MLEAGLGIPKGSSFLDEQDSARFQLCLVNCRTSSRSVKGRSYVQQKSKYCVQPLGENSDHINHRDL